MKNLSNYLPHLPHDLIDELETHGTIQSFPEDTTILREGQFIKMVPLVLEGVIKVFTRHEDRELLLYYIEAGESCIMSFHAGLKNMPSKVFAFAEEQTVLLLMPVEHLNRWINQIPAINDLFYNLYNQRYASLLDTINHLLYNRLDERLYNYLCEVSKQKNSKLLTIRHRQIAAELGTVREVISRVMKKLEQEGKVQQLPNAIKIL